MKSNKTISSHWPWASEKPSIEYTPDLDWPKISIITPSYNQGHFIEKTIRSIILQNYPNLEFIIIDGGSTDETLEIIKKYDSEITYWESHPDRGQSDAINRGFERATGDIFTWLNTDDYYLPDALYTIAQAYLNNQEKDIHVWVGAADKVDEKGQLIYHSQPEDLTIESFYYWRHPKKPKGKGNFLQPSCFFTRKAWEVAGPLDLELEYCMDVALWLRMAENFQFVAIPQKLAVAVGHSDAKTTKDIEYTTVEVALVLSEYGGREVAKVDLLKMTDNYIALRKKWENIVKSPPYRIYKRVKKIFFR
jgi:glycosyltransferase involved in cell wall biosynthesis